MYGVRLNKDGIMMLSKKFDIDSDRTIIDGVRYAGTPGFYEFIFKKAPDYDMYTKDDKRKYKSILLAITCIDAIIPSTVIYGVTRDTSIDL